MKDSVQGVLIPSPSGVTGRFENLHQPSGQGLKLICSSPIVRSLDLGKQTRGAFTRTAWKFRFKRWDQWSGTKYRFLQPQFSHLEKEDIKGALSLPGLFLSLEDQLRCRRLCIAMFIKVVQGLWTRGFLAWWQRDRGASSQICPPSLGFTDTRVVFAPVCCVPVARSVPAFIYCPLSTLALCIWLAI